jgi:hypothetical protein
LAFQRGEVTPDGQPTDDALLGAMMTSEYQAFMLSWGEAWGEWVKAWVKSKKRRRR